MVKVTICMGSSCHIKGSRQVVEQLQYLVKVNKLSDDVDLSGMFCMGKCATEGVAVTVDGEFYPVQPDKVNEFFDDVIVKKVNAK